LCARADAIASARRFRKMLGGGMRQAGVVAAAALYALEHHRERLEEDHRAARRLAELLHRCPAVNVDPARVETNIVMLDVDADAVRVVEAARSAGVLVHAVGRARLRAVTHLDLDARAIEQGARRLAAAIQSAAAEP
jgi:threonine aldolase